MRELLSGVVQRKYIQMTAWRKQVNLQSHSWYGVAFHSQTKKERNIISKINAYVYIEILDNFLIQSIENRFGEDKDIFGKIMYLITEQKGFKFSSEKT